jgi:prolycopene isomerase
MSRKYDYDAIIIGAGISGLVCGCYLAKAGMKTLIVEKNAKPGGYCTSFKRGGYQFDACVHSLGSLREGGNISVILNELDLEERLNITRHDPSDIIIAPDFEIRFWNNLDKTIQEFQGKFPKESETIERSFKYINSCEGMTLSSLRSMTFQDLINRYFNDDRLKGILSFPVVGNAGVASGKISALTGILIYKEFILDGGYYPDGSMQALADILTERFKEFGGDLYCSSTANKIKLKKGKVEAVDVEKKGQFSAKYVISNADASQTFFTLIGEELLSEDIIKTLSSLKPSISMFILYLGLSENFKVKHKFSPNTNVWYLPHYDVDNMYYVALEGDIDNLDCFLFRLLSDGKSILSLVFAPFKDKEYWKNNKRRLMDVFINKIEKLIPNLSSNIAFKDAATPQTLYKWTRNYKGAAYGWAGLPSQLAVTGLTQRTSFENLYLTGHWTTLVQGVAGVAYLGRDTSKKILVK